MSSDEITPEELSRFGKYLASRRRSVEGKCEICGKPIKGTTKRRYCSNTCAARAYRQRRRLREIEGDADAVGRDPA